MNSLKKGLLQTGYSLRKHKLLFSVIITLQFILIISCSYFLITSQIKIFEDVEQMILPLQSVDLNTANQDLSSEPSFIQDPLSIYNHYNSLKRNLFQLALELFLLFVLINGSIWIFTHQLLQKSSWKDIFQMSLKFISLTLVAIIVIFLIIWLLLKIITVFQVASGTFIILIKALLFFILIIYYLLLVSFAFIPLKSWKHFLILSLKTAVLQIHFNLLVLFLNLMAIGLFFYFSYLSLNTESIWLISLASLLLIITIVLTRIFWIAVLQEKMILQKKNNEKDYP